MTNTNTTTHATVRCWNCDGAGRTENPYFHHCDAPLCQGDAPAVECVTCDGCGTLPDGD